MRTRYTPLLMITLLALPLSGCSTLMPGSDAPKASANNETRGQLEVPAELQGDVVIPEPDQVAVVNETEVSGTDAGTRVGVDARAYANTPGEVLSAVVDAMTALNLPVESVDSPSGTVTTDWTRQDASSMSTLSPVAGIFGGAAGNAPTRYRFVVRVFRQAVDGVAQARLEVRTIAQAFLNRHWVNQPLKRKVNEELFAAVEERLQARP